MRSRNEILSSIFRQGGTGYFESGDTVVEAGELPRHVYRLRTGLAYQSCWFPDCRFQLKAAAFSDLKAAAFPI